MAEILHKTVKQALSGMDQALSNTAPAELAIPELTSFAHAGGAGFPSPFSVASGGLFSTQSLSHSTSASAAAAASAASGSASLSRLERLITAGKPAGTTYCRPYSHEDYLTRLTSFRPGPRWFNKSGCTPPLCARFGWLVDVTDMLMCDVCSARIKAPSALTALDAEDTAALTAQLCSAHKEACPWKNNPSPASYASLLLPPSHGSLPALPHGASMAREALKVRFHSLLALPSLPPLQPDMAALADLAAAVCGYDEPEAWTRAVLTLLSSSGVVGATPFRAAVATAAVGASESTRRTTAAVLALLG